MSFPNLKGKHAEDAMFTPTDYLKYKKKRGKHPKFKPPIGIIFCYQKILLDYIIKNHKVTKVEGFYGDTYLLDETKGKIGVVGNFGVGAPIIGALLEELIAFGVKKFISVGTAGTLQKNLKYGDLVVCEKAIRDEGLSYHYIKPSKYSHASKKLTKKLIKFLEKANQKYIIGTGWTTDAPYRETVTEVKKYQEEGVTTVDMEASALFAIAKYRNVDFGAVFSISDSLAELKWTPKFHAKRTRKGLEILYKIVVNTLLD
jgi:uridine phosphorylase